jgi:microcystin-dependent protein
MATKTFIRTASQTSSVVPGAIMQYAGIAAPSGYLLCNGSQVLRSAYSTLFNILNPNIGTVSIAVGVNTTITKNNHGLATGDKIYFTSTGTLPLPGNMIFYASVVNSNSFRLATSVLNLTNGVLVSTSVAEPQSGVHSIVRSPYGNGDGSITFHLPDFRGRVATGTHSNSVSNYFKAHGETGGSVDHTHYFSDTSSTTTFNTTTLASAGNTTSIVRPSTSHTHTVSGNTQAGSVDPYLTVNYIIKT